MGEKIGQNESVDRAAQIKDTLSMNQLIHLGKGYEDIKKYCDEQIRELEDLKNKVEGIKFAFRIEKVSSGDNSRMITSFKIYSADGKLVGKIVETYSSGSENDTGLAGGSYTEYRLLDAEGNSVTMERDTDKDSLGFQKRDGEKKEEFCEMMLKEWRKDFGFNRDASVMLVPEASEELIKVIKDVFGQN